jgi:hypothetical protein
LEFTVIVNYRGWMAFIPQVLAQEAG